MMPDREKVIAWLADEELYYRDHGDTHNSLMACYALDLLKEQEIVRCKDCEHCYFASNRIPDERSYACGKHGIDIVQDWFCADGERKE